MCLYIALGPTVPTSCFLRPLPPPFAMAGVPEKVVQEVEACMSSTAPINSKVDSIVQLLRSNGLAHEQVLTPAQILVHPENRGKTMVAFHDVWAKGVQMASVRFQKKMLEGATICTQLATSESKRQAQIAANRQLVADSKGHLAPVSGQEGPLAMPFFFIKFCHIRNRICLVAVFSSRMQAS